MFALARCKRPKACAPSLCLPLGALPGAQGATQTARP